MINVIIHSFVDHINNLMGKSISLIVNILYWNEIIHQSEHIKSQKWLEKNVYIIQ